MDGAALRASTVRKTAGMAPTSTRLTCRKNPTQLRSLCLRDGAQLSVHRDLWGESTLAHEATLVESLQHRRPDAFTNESLIHGASVLIGGLKGLALRRRILVLVLLDSRNVLLDLIDDNVREERVFVFLQSVEEHLETTSLFRFRMPA